MIDTTQIYLLIEQKYISIILFENLFPVVFVQRSINHNMKHDEKIKQINNQYFALGDYSLSDYYVSKIQTFVTIFYVFFKKFTKLSIDFIE